MSDEIENIDDADLLPAEEAIEQMLESPTLEPAAPAPAEAEAEAAETPDETVGGKTIARYSQQQVRRARELLTRLYATRRAARFYPVEHPAVAEGIEALLESFEEYHAEGVDVHLAFLEGEILLGEQLLAEESVLFDQLVRDMMAIGVGTVVVRRGATAPELTRAMRILSADAAGIRSLGGMERAIADLNFEHVVIGAAQVLERAGHDGAATAEDARAVYSSSVSLMREIDRLVRTNHHVSTGRVKGVVRSMVDNVLSNRYAMLQLTGLKNYDEYTFYHSANVAILSLALGSSITTDYRFLSSLGVGALLHDIGKLSVSANILNKPGALSPDEWASVRQHPVFGAEMVSLLPGVDKGSLVTILEHHMRFDCTGYPTRTPARRQHLASRIVAVADSYDAMTSRRSYSAARVQDEAMALLVKSAGSSLDPGLVRLFVRLMGVYPPRSVVRMVAGDIGVVLRPSATDPVRPVVRIIALPSGDLVEPVDIDLSQTTEVRIRSCIDPELLNIDVDAYL